MLAAFDHESWVGGHREPAAVAAAAALGGLVAAVAAPMVVIVRSEAYMAFADAAWAFGSAYSVVLEPVVAEAAAASAGEAAAARSFPGSEEAC